MITTISYKDIPNIKTKYNRAIVFLLSKTLFEYQGVMIINLIKTNKNNYDVIVLFEYDLTDEQKEFLVTIEPRCLFIHYIKQDFFDELSLPDSLVSDMSQISHVHTQYGKHVIFKLLNFCNKVLLLEQDMIINGDISDVFSEQGPAIAWIRNYEGHFKNSLGVTVESKGIELPRNIQASNAGFYYVDNTIPYNKVYEFVTNFKKQLLMINKKTFLALDELAINYSLYKYCSNVRIMPANDWNISPIYSSDTTKLIHCKFGMKPGTNQLVLFLFPQWLNFYREWISLGGKEIKGIDLNQYSGYVKNAFINEHIIHMLFDILNSNISSLRLVNEYTPCTNLIELFNKKSHLQFLYKNKFIINIEFIVWLGCHKFMIEIKYKINTEFNQNTLEKLCSDNSFLYEVDRENVVLKTFRPIEVDNNFKNFFVKTIKTLDDL